MMHVYYLHVVVSSTSHINDRLPARDKEILHFYFKVDIKACIHVIYVLLSS